MRPITPSLTPELKAHCGGAPVWRADPFWVESFRHLVEHVAKLAYLNRDDLLFFRGQDKDYQSKTGGTTLYPPIYRGDAVPAHELRHRFDLLDQACRLLKEKFKRSKIDGSIELRQKRYVQWSILQHYEVAATPLLDLTHSLRVACSFAQQKATDPTCYVYVLGLPYITNRITINSEHDVVNVRLLSICPPAALRPYFQEGYLAGTSDVLAEFESKTELDFRNRLIAKFAMPRAASSFWGSGFDPIPDSALFPRGDKILEICEQLKSELETELQPGDMGLFLKQWARLEGYLLENARRITGRNVSLREAVAEMERKELFSQTIAHEIQSIRVFRNNLVHKPHTVEQAGLQAWLDRLQATLRLLEIRT